MRKRLLAVSACVLVTLAVFSPVCHSGSNVGEEIAGFPPGWTEDIQLTFIPGLGSNARSTIATNGDIIHVVWNNNTDGQLGYCRSEDAGRTWTEPRVITSGNVAWDAKIAVNGSHVHLVYGKDYVTSFEIVYQNSTDNGETWNTPVLLTPSDGIKSQLPDIAVEGDTIHVVWEDWAGGMEIMYRNSTDGGKSWNPTIPLTNYPGGSDATARIVINGSIVHVVWGRFVTATGSFETMYRRSLDGGSTWEAEMQITKPGSGHSYAPDLAVNGSSVYAIWMDSRNGAWETYINISFDDGITWNGGIALTDIDGRNSFGAYVGAWNETVYVVWGDPRDDYPYPEAHEAYMNYSFDGGVTWQSSNERLQFALNNSGPNDIVITENYVHLVLVDNRTGKREIFYKRYPDFQLDPEYNITLDEGWNLISLPLEQSGELIDQVLSSINGKWDCIQTYDAINDIWSSNVTSRPDNLNDLNILNHKMGFWINITEPNVNLTVRGYIPSSTSIPLYAGWNLVGYPSLTNETVANALFGTTADAVEVFDPAEPYRIKEVGPTYVMKPGEGYWVHVPVDSVWVVNW